MKLDNNQLKELYEAILDGFSEGDLRKLVYFELGFSLEEKAGGKDFSEKVFNLVVHCERHGLLETLIYSAYRENTNNFKIKFFYEQHLHVQHLESENELTFTSRRRANHFPDVRDFDLSILMDEVKRELLKDENSKGLISIVIPCNGDKFRVIFCERLQERLNLINLRRQGRAKTLDVRTLNPKFHPIEEVTKEIYRRCKSALSQKRDVIYCIKVSSELKNADYANKFWQTLEGEFENFDFSSRLIIFMNGEDKTIFPDASLRFKPPIFNRDHVWNWIGPIKNNSNWEGLFWEDVWMDCMKEKCMQPSNEELRIDTVYQFLETTIQLLGQGSSDKEDFIDELRYRVSV